MYNTNKDVLKYVLVVFAHTMKVSGVQNNIVYIV